MQWNPDGTVLTISPDSPLEYAEGTGTDPTTVPARAYAITIGADAADLAGNPLGAAMELTFQTRRRLVASFPTDPALSRSLRGETLLASVSFFIGDSATKQTYRSYVTFDLSTLPAGSEVELATFEGLQLGPFGAPYNLGAIMAQHLTFATMDSVNTVAATSLPGQFSSDAILETKRLDITSQVQEDVINRAARADRSQYRLQIDQATNDDDVNDTAVFQKNTFKLIATYVVD